ncbi:SMC family ATPase [Candidatus Woesearchaeota archaeon]|jgi:DNA repair protein SbcC/Rad50|nr:SMC family ATPase [Candidatus Woesearchaeota archaeon]
MILKWIQLQNIRSFTEAKIEFEKGSTLLSGDIGSGKSSILSALEFGLFGAMRGLLSSNALLRKGTNAGHVELCFLLDKKEIIIKRRLKKQNNSVVQDTGYLIIDGVKTEGTTTELRARVLELLGYPHELLTKSKGLIFRYTVYTPQDQMKQIVLEDKELRLNTLRLVFGIDKYKKIRENVQIIIKNTKDKKKELVGQIYDLEEKKKKLEESAGFISELIEQENKIRPILISVKEELIQKRNLMKGLDDKIKLSQDIKQKIEILTSVVDEKNNQIEKEEKEIEQLKTEITTIKIKLAELEENLSVETIETISSDITSIEQKILTNENLEKTLLRENALIKEREKQIDMRILNLKEEKIKKQEKEQIMISKKNEYSELIERVKDKQLIHDTIHKIDFDILELSKKINGFEIMNMQSQKLKEKISQIDSCPTCEQTVSNEHKQKINERENSKIAECIGEIKQLETQKTEIMNLVDCQRKKLEEVRAIEIKISEISGEIKNESELKIEINNLIILLEETETQRKEILTKISELDASKIEEIRKEIINHKEKIKILNETKIKLTEIETVSQRKTEKIRRLGEHITFLEETQEKVLGLNKKLEELQQKYKSFDGLQQEYSLKKIDFERLLEEEKKIEVKKQGIEKEKESWERTQTELKTEVITKEESKRRITKCENEIRWLDEMFIKLMETMEKQVMMKVYHEFKELFTTWFDLLIEDETITASLDDEFSPNILQNGHELELDYLSGGEKTSVALAYRLALNKVINDVVSNIKTKDLLVLDEPTDGFSTEQLDRVRDVLDQLNTEQVIIVSHESKIESFVNKVIRIEKNEHVSRIV